MKLSIIIINTNPDTLQETQDSLKYQTHSDYEEFVVEANCDDVNGIVSQITGEYCLFLNSGDCLANDNVLEEILLNELDKDIVYGNLILNSENKEKVITLPKNLRASDLILTCFPYQCIFIQVSLLKSKEARKQLLPIAIWTFIVNALLNDKKTFKHIQMCVARCNKDNLLHYTDEFYNLRKGALKEVMPLFCADLFELNSLRIANETEEQKTLKKLSRSVFFKWLMVFRKKSLDCGLYELKANIKQKRHYKKIKKQDEARKKQVYKEIFEMGDNLLQRNNDETDIIVSLTTFGRRLNNSAPYAIYSILTQSELPNRVVLFIDKKHQKTEFSPIFKKLLSIGVEIEYIDDIKSFTKLLPALRKFPDNPIVTVDDDIYYDREWFSRLKKSYLESDKKSVLFYKGRIVERKNNHITLYNSWLSSGFGTKHSVYSPYGVYGVLYPPRIFNDEIFRSDIFLKLCPNADDLWFWIQEYRNQIKVIRVNPDGFRFDMVDSENYLITRKSDALYFKNDIHGGNDKQFSELLTYYKLE